MTLFRKILQLIFSDTEYPHNDQPDPPTMVWRFLVKIIAVAEYSQVKDEHSQVIQTFKFLPALKWKAVSFLPFRIEVIYSKLYYTCSFNKPYISVEIILNTVISALLYGILIYTSSPLKYLNERKSQRMLMLRNWIKINILGLRILK